jgi:hypothetical protein
MEARTRYPPVVAYSQKYNVRSLYLTFLVWLSIKNRSDDMPCDCEREEKADVLSEM